LLKLSESRKDNYADPYTVVIPWKSESILVYVVKNTLPQRELLNWLVVAESVFLFMFETRLIIPFKLSPKSL
jgi:hypothetical protein